MCIRILRAAVCALIVSALVPAQWDALPFDASGPVVAEGFLVVHEKPDGVWAFSAAARHWTRISPAGATILGTGDWVATTQESGGVRGYSARRNDSALLPVPRPQRVVVDDDVAVVIAGRTAHAYSAQTNTWVALAMTTAPDQQDIAVSRFVVVIRDDRFYHGFAARTGAWSSFSASVPGEPPLADGNTAVADLFDRSAETGIRHVAAFSGVRGYWTLSPLYFEPYRLRLDHNVAVIGVPVSGPTFRACAYSTYTGAWITSSAQHDQGDFTTRIGDNLVRLEDVRRSPRFEAFGARPGRAWQGHDAGIDLASDEDVSLLWDPGAQRLVAFGGLRDGTWTVSGPVGGSGFPTVVGSPDHMALLRSGTGQLHAYVPALNRWVAPFIPLASSSITAEDAVADVFDTRDDTLIGCAARWGGWVRGPSLPGASFLVTPAGSVIAHQEISGPRLGDIHLFDERANAWSTFSVGGPSSIVPGRNLLVTHSGMLPGPVWGYSVQRGDWTSPPLTPPLRVTPNAEENVAWLVDGADRLWAFGSPGDGHVWTAWPNGTEYLPSDPTPGATLGARLATSIQGSGVTALTLLAPRPLFPGLTIPGFAGRLCLDPTTLLPVGLPVVVDADHLAEVFVPITSRLAAGVSLWLQPLMLDPAPGPLRFGTRCDAAWFF